MSNSENIRVALLDAISRDVALMKSDKIFISPNIPTAKLNNAIQSYGNGISPNDVLILVDDTVFGSAKDGLLLTMNLLATKRSYESAKFIYLNKINEINFIKSWIYVNGVSFSELIQLNYKHFGNLASILNRHITEINALEKETINTTSSLTDSQVTAQNKKTPLLDKENSSFQLSDFVLLSGVTSITSSETYFSPNIPSKKLSGVQASHGGLINQADVVILIDDTVFGSAKDGVAITNEFIYIKEGSGLARKYKLSEILEIFSKEKSIFINGKNVAKISLAGKLELGYVFSVVNEYLQTQKIPKITIDKEKTLANAQIIDICQKYTHPKYRETINGLAFDKPKTTPKYYVGKDISQKTLTMVRFCLSISEQDEILAVADLTRHGDNSKNAFVVTANGIYSKSENDTKTTYVGWSELRRIKLIEAYESSYLCGVSLSNNQKIACTWKNTIVQPFGFDLINDLIECAGGERVYTADLPNLQNSMDKLTHSQTQDSSYNTIPRTEPSYAPSRSRPIPLNNIPQDQIYDLIKSINTIDNVFSFASAMFGSDDDLNSKTRKSFQTCLAKSVTVFREHIVNRQNIPELANDFATIEVSAAIISILAILMDHRSVPERISQQIILEGIKASFSLSGSVQTDPLGTLILKTIAAYVSNAGDDPDSVFALLMLRLIGSNINKAIRPYYDIDKIKSVSNADQAVMEFATLMEPGLTKFHKETLFEVDFLIDTILDAFSRRN